MDKSDQMSEYEQEQIRRRAIVLVDDPILKMSLEELKARYTRAWAISHPADTAKREAAYSMIQAVAALEEQLHHYASMGSINNEAVQEFLRRNS